MTKGELFELLDFVDWDEEIYLETENGIFPICNEQSGMIEDKDVDLSILVLAPCHCQPPTEEDIILQNLIDKQKNPDEN